MHPAIWGLPGSKSFIREKINSIWCCSTAVATKNREKFKFYANDPSVKLVWGDLTNYEDVLACVTGADYILHVGGMVSPAADYFPKRTMKTNIGAIENIIRAIKAQPIRMRSSSSISAPSPKRVTAIRPSTGAARAIRS